MKMAQKYFFKNAHSVCSGVCVLDDSGFCLEVSGLLGVFPNILIVL